ncbi:hypothetical protein [Flavobacterium sp.]|uniref:hypothetical protein n=1 Tax=Flavobacterium sp. TaxID=239 RepID=UPI0039E601AE
MAYDFKLRSVVTDKGKTAHYAKLSNTTEAEFFIGYKTYYKEQDGYGLYNSSQLTNLVYNSDDYAAEFGFFAHFIAPTAKAESHGSFICLNTYDRAYFTFGFMQFAAHVPNGDFVKFLRKLLTLHNAKDYFPRLKLIDNRIFYVSDTGTQTQLESDGSTKPLMEYLNPGLRDVEHQELICSARMIHWATHDIEHRKIQASDSINLYKNNLVKYHNRLGLDGYPAKVCLMVCDILHQGRGKFDRIANALDTNGNHEKAFTNLCSIGEVNYADRISSLKKSIKALETNGIFNKKYQAATHSFV